MVLVYCDSCGNQITTHRYIKRLLRKVGKAKDVTIHAYVTSSHDLCQECIVKAVIEAQGLVGS